MTARDDLYAYAGTPCVLPERMLDAKLDAYAAEVRAAALREAADAIDVDDSCGCGGCDACVLRNAAASIRDLADEAAPADDLRGGFWPGMTGGLCSRCHIAEGRGGQPDPDCADCRTLAEPAEPPQDGDPCPWAAAQNRHAAHHWDVAGPNAWDHTDGFRRCLGYDGPPFGADPTTRPADRPADDTQQQDGAGPHPCSGCRFIPCDTCPYRPTAR